MTFLVVLQTAEVQEIARIPLALMSCSDPRIVKKLDLLESNHDCGLNGLSREKHSKRDVTQRYTFHI